MTTDQGQAREGLPEEPLCGVELALERFRKNAEQDRPWYEMAEDYDVIAGFMEWIRNHADAGWNAADVERERAEAAEAKLATLQRERDEAVAAGKRVTAAFRALGRSSGIAETATRHNECEAAMVALAAALGEPNG